MCHKHTSQASASISTNFLLLTQDFFRYARRVSDEERSIHQYVTRRRASSNAAERKKDKLEGAIAQLGEHLLCKQGVRGSIPRSSTMLAKSIIKIVFLPNVYRRKKFRGKR